MVSIHLGSGGSSSSSIHCTVGLEWKCNQTGEGCVVFRAVCVLLIRRFHNPKQHILQQ